MPEQRPVKRQKTTPSNKTRMTDPPAAAAAPPPAPAAAAAQSDHVCPLLQSGVLSVLLHHAAVTDDHSIVCRLLCVSAELNSILHAQCVGLVTISSTQKLPQAWIKQYAPLLRCLVIDFRGLNKPERLAAEDSLSGALLAAESRLKLGALESHSDTVNVTLLKRLPCSTMTRLVFTDSFDTRHKKNIERKKADKRTKAAAAQQAAAQAAAQQVLQAAAAQQAAQQAAAEAAAAEQAAAAAAAAAAASQPAPAEAAGLAAIARAAAAEQAAPAAAAGDGPEEAAAEEAAAEEAAAEEAAAEEAAAQQAAEEADHAMEGLEGPGAGASAAAAGSTAAAAAAAGPSKGGVSKHKRKGPKPAKLGGLQELGAAVRRLVGLRELQVTAANGYADILIPQAAPLKHLSRLQLSGMWSPAKELSKHSVSLRALRSLSLTYKGTAHKPKQAPTLDLAKCKALVELQLINGALTAGDLLPDSLTCIEVSSCTSLTPLRPLKGLRCLAVSRTFEAQAAAALAAGGDVWALPYADLDALRTLTELRLMAQPMPPEAVLPAGLQRLQLHSLKDSVKQLTHLQSLTRLDVGQLDVSPRGLPALTSLRDLAHITWTLALPPGPPALGPEPPCEATQHLKTWSECGLPVAACTLRGAVLDPQGLGYIGACRHLTQLQLQACSGKIGDAWSPADPYKCLSDPITTWTQLRSLTLTGTMWRLHLPACITRQPGEMSPAELGAVLVGRPTHERSALAVVAAEAGFEREAHLKRELEAAVGRALRQTVAEVVVQLGGVAVVDEAVADAVAGGAVEAAAGGSGGQGAGEGGSAAAGGAGEGELAAGAAEGAASPPAATAAAAGALAAAAGDPAAAAAAASNGSTVTAAVPRAHVEAYARALASTVGLSVDNTPYVRKGKSGSGLVEAAAAAAKAAAAAAARHAAGATSAGAAAAAAPAVPSGSAWSGRPYALVGEAMLNATLEAHKVVRAFSEYNHLSAKRVAAKAVEDLERLAHAETDAFMKIFAAGPAAAAEMAAAEAAAAQAAAAAAEAQGRSGPPREVCDSLADVISSDGLLHWHQWARSLAGAVGSLTQLTHLDLSSWPLGESVTSLRPLTRLRSLQLEHTSQSDFSLMGLLPALGQLTELSLTGNSEVTRAPLAAVDLLLPHLVRLDVGGCSGLKGDPGFKEWVKKHTHVQVKGLK